jgi:hypothetical protein
MTAVYEFSETRRSGHWTQKKLKGGSNFPWLGKTSLVFNRRSDSVRLTVSKGCEEEGGAI